jgi:hypothetical protein
MLTQLATIKTRLRLNSFDLEDDVFLTGLIKHASGRFAKECNRVFERGVDVLFEFRGDEMNISPDRYPIEAVSGFDLKSTEVEGWISQPEVDYLLSPQKCMIELATGLGTSRQNGRVTFTGGYVLPGATAGAGQTALPDELEQACLDQVVYWYENRHRLGLLSTSGEGGVIQQMKSLDLLPHVAAILRKYERWVN